MKINKLFESPTSIHPDSAWVLSEQSVVIRMYAGITSFELRWGLFKNKWHIDLGRNNTDDWAPLSQQLRNTEVGEQFREAIEQEPYESGQKKYLPGRYELVIVNNKPRLVSHYFGMQLSDIQTLELHIDTDAEQAYRGIKQAMFPMYDVKGAVFYSMDFTKSAKLLRSEFDYEGYEIHEQS